MNRRCIVPVAGVCVAVSIATTSSGCGSAGNAELPHAATAAVAPEPTAPPAGRVVVGAREKLAVASDVAPSTATLGSGTLNVTVNRVARTLTITDRSGRIVNSKPAGVGPTHVACAANGPCFVVDTGGDALLVFRVGAGGRTLRLTRRVYVAGTPYAIAIDGVRHRLWVTLTARNEVVELPSHGRPHILQRLPTLRQPNRVAVDSRSGDVLVAPPGAATMQIIPNPATVGG
jgi:DNA-binding beta-propeller fold protein YncE